MSSEVTPLRIKSASVDQSEDAIEDASVKSVAGITIGFDREPSAVEKSAIKHHFDVTNGPEPILSEPSFLGARLKFRAVDPNGAVAVVDYLRTQAKNLAERTEDRRTQAAEMLSELEQELQPPREKGDFRPVME